MCMSRASSRAGKSIILSECGHCSKESDRYCPIHGCFQGAPMQGRKQKLAKPSELFISRHFAVAAEVWTNIAL